MSEASVEDTGSRISAWKAQHRTSDAPDQVRSDQPKSRRSPAASASSRSPIPSARGAPLRAASVAAAAAAAAASTYRRPTTPFEPPASAAIFNRLFACAPTKSPLR
ncbi:hypothetical protein ZWY2020_049994 [Hordeum vulgare]|nr:hypothetical protein ZWY2020_049994 [Hordeum vulgare]